MCCTRCGGRRRVLEAVTDPEAAARILIVQSDNNLGQDNCFPTCFVSDSNHAVLGYFDGSWSAAAEGSGDSPGVSVQIDY